MDKTIIADKLRRLRDGRKQSMVAEACGISKAAYSMYETRRRVPNDEVKQRLAEFYGTTVQSLFYEQ